MTSQFSNPSRELAEALRRIQAPPLSRRGRLLSFLRAVVWGMR